MRHLSLLPLAVKPDYSRSLVAAQHKTPHQFRQLIIGALLSRSGFGKTQTPDRQSRSDCSPINSAFALRMRFDKRRRRDRYNSRSISLIRFAADKTRPTLMKSSFVNSWPLRVPWLRNDIADSDTSL